MTTLGLIHGLGSVGPFASRAFLPAFVTALLLRFGPEVPLVRELGLFQQVEGTPTWFTSDAALWILGVLSLLEILASRSEEIRTLLADADGWIKGGVAMLAQVGVVSATDEAFARGVFEASVFDWFGTAAVGAGTVIVARARRGVVDVLAEADQDDSLGIAGLLRWAEEIWAAGAAVLLLLFPVFMLLVTGLVVGTLLLLQWAAKQREQRRLVPCRSCGVPTYTCAPRCTNLHEQPPPNDVGLLGNAVDRPARNDHPFRLLAKRRCPRCATRVGRAVPGARCPGCRLALLADPPTADEFVGWLDRKLPLVLFATLLLGAVPVLGLVPGIVLYRFALVAPMAGYVGRGRRTATRFVLRVVLVLLLSVQWIPAVGALAVPLMALLSYRFYRGAFVAQLGGR